MQNDIHRAFEFAGDVEMDKLADEFITSVIFSTCVYNKAFTKSPEFRMDGMGWWCSMMTVWDLMNEKPIKNILHSYSRPVLILRGDADYLTSGIANQYHTVFPNSRLIKSPRPVILFGSINLEFIRKKLKIFYFTQQLCYNLSHATDHTRALVSIL